MGNLDPDVDEKLLYDTFSAFGVILQHPKIMRDQDTGASKACAIMHAQRPLTPSQGFAFINFASFEAADSAMEAMNGQYLCNRPISCTYALRKDGRGERHGSQAGACRALVATLPSVIICVFRAADGGAEPAD